MQKGRNLRTQTHCSPSADRKKSTDQGSGSSNNTPQTGGSPRTQGRMQKGRNLRTQTHCSPSADKKMSADPGEDPEQSFTDNFQGPSVPSPQTRCQIWSEIFSSSQTATKSALNECLVKLRSLPFPQWPRRVGSTVHGLNRLTSTKVIGLSTSGFGRWFPGFSLRHFSSVENPSLQLEPLPDPSATPREPAHTHTKVIAHQNGSPCDCVHTEILTYIWCTTIIMGGFQPQMCTGTWCTMS